MAKPTTATPQASNSGARPISQRPSGPSIVSFFHESRAELRKVTWPTRQEATNLTTAVIGMTVALALFLGLIDAGWDKLVSLLLGTG